MTAGLPARRRCRECGNTFLAIRHDQVFCNPACRRAWHTWREGRGARAVELLVRWRCGRQRGSLTALSGFADELVRDHRHREGRQDAASRGEG